MSNRYIDQNVEFIRQPSGEVVGYLAPFGAQRNIPYILAQGGVSIGKAPSGAMAANGAVTLGTALNRTYSDGIWLYYPAGAVYAGSVAGFYWTVMSDIVSGTVYDTTYTPGIDSYDTPSSPTAIVAAGPGGFTGVTSEITAVSVPLPGGSLGKHGGFKVGYLSWNNNSGTGKGVNIMLAGTGIGGVSNSTTNTMQRAEIMTRNQGIETKQQATGWTSFGSSTMAGYLLTRDTTTDLAIALALSGATATDWAILDNFEIEVLPS